jgi:hypothetical protein
VRTTIIVPNEVLTRDEPIVFHSLYIWAKHYEFYVNGSILDEGKAETLNITIPKRLIPPSGSLNIAVKIDPGNLPYQGIAHRKDLLIGDKDQLKRTSWSSVELTTTYWLWFLIPKLTFCFIFAILYIFLAQNRELFSFILYIFLSSISLFIESAYADGLKNLGVNSALAAPLLLCFSDLFLILFFHDFYRRDGKTFYHKLKRVMSWFAVLALAIIILLPSKSAVNAVLAFEIIFRAGATLYGLYCSLFTILLLQRSGKSPSRKTIASILFTVLMISIIPVTFEGIRVVADILNLNIGGFPYMQAFDLILFAVLSSITAHEFGMTATVKQQIESELKVMEERMELGRSVQNLLLPQETEGSSFRSKFEFFFESAQTMAGDWYYIWEPTPGETRLFIGDVTGKGPQAALAVSAIISVLAGCKEEGFSVEQTICTLNRRIHTIFNRKVFSVMNVTVLHGNKDVDLYNLGTGGWIVRRNGIFDLVTVQGSQIGIDSEIQVRKTSLKMEPGDIAFTFTDGVLEGSRALKKLISGMTDNQTLVSGNDYFKYAVGIGEKYVHFDDKTMLFVKFSNTNKDLKASA